MSGQPGGRRKLAHLFEESGGGKHRLKGQIVAQGFIVQLHRKTVELEKRRQRGSQREGIFGGDQPDRRGDALDKNPVHKLTAEGAEARRGCNLTFLTSASLGVLCGMKSY